MSYEAELGEDGVLRISRGMQRCTGTTVAGGAVTHERLCPMHPLESKAAVAEGKLERARQEVARLVRDGTNRGYLLAGYALVALEQILGLSLTHDLRGHDAAPFGLVDPDALRAAALREAADGIEAANCYGESGVIAWLRERADRIGGAT